MLLDSEEFLWLDYLERSKEDVVAFSNLQTWRLALDQKANKILLSEVNNTGVADSDFISQVAIRSPSTCRRYIVTNNNLSYAEKLDELRSQGVELLPEFNIHNSAIDRHEAIYYNATDFYHHMLGALALVASTRANKLENEHNDFLRDLLSFKGYTIRDQPRLGRSASGLSIGNLDLAVMQNNHWVTIIEPLRLRTIDSANIISHYNKLIDNYNPLYLPNTHLVVYYIGEASGFNDFHERYIGYVVSLKPDDFSSDVVFNNITHTNQLASGIRSFIQQGTINGHDFSCSHTCISFSG